MSVIWDITYDILFCCCKFRHCYIRSIYSCIWLNKQTTNYFYSTSCWCCSNGALVCYAAVCVCVGVQVIVLQWMLQRCFLAHASWSTTCRFLDTVSMATASWTVRQTVGWDRRDTTGKVWRESFLLKCFCACLFGRFGVLLTALVTSTNISYVEPT